jgi:F0F1-type ATP synthase assembly protein I
MPKDGQWQQYGKYLGLAFVLPSCTLVGYLIGKGLDKLFGTHFLTFIFLLLGIAAGFIDLIRETKPEK